MPTPLYVTFVVVGLAIGAALVALLVGVVVSIVRQPALGPAGKVGWILLCLVYRTSPRLRGSPGRGARTAVRASHTGPLSGRSRRQRDRALGAGRK